MKKLFVILALVGSGWYLFGGQKNTPPATPSPANPNLPTPPQNSFAAPFEKTHVVMLDNNYSIVVHNGEIYGDDTPGYLEMYFSQYGQKEATFPNWELFSSHFPTPKLLKELFA
jgi:hypothetical protein